MEEQVKEAAAQAQEETTEAPQAEAAEVAPVDESAIVAEVVEEIKTEEKAEQTTADILQRADVRAEIAKQTEAMMAGDVDRFGKLDYAFHELLCAIAKVDFAFDVILEQKAKVDRLCLLSLSKEQRMPELVEDHRAIANAIISNNIAEAQRMGVLHLSRLDETIERISQTNANYFERSGA